MQWVRAQSQTGRSDQMVVHMWPHSSSFWTLAMLSKRVWGMGDTVVQGADHSEHTAASSLCRLGVEVGVWATGMDSLISMRGWRPWVTSHIAITTVTTMDKKTLTRQSQPHTRVNPPRLGHIPDQSNPPLLVWPSMGVFVQFCFSNFSCDFNRHTN